MINNVKQTVWQEQTSQARVRKCRQPRSRSSLQVGVGLLVPEDLRDPHAKDGSSPLGRDLGSRCTVGLGKLDRARSRLYRSQILQQNMRLKALAEIYTMHSFAQLCNLIFFVKILPMHISKKSANNSAIKLFLTNKLRFQNGAKECIV